MNALEYATEKHKGQKRKDGKEYITHPIAVSEIAVKIAEDVWESYMTGLYNWSWIEQCRYDFAIKGEVVSNDELKHRFLEAVKVISLLHDTVEDTDATLDEIEQLFGDLVARCVDRLTKRKNENYLDAILRVKSTLLSTIVKVADLRHNMSDLNEGSLKDKYRLAEHILERELCY